MRLSYSKLFRDAMKDPVARREILALGRDGKSEAKVEVNGKSYTVRVGSSASRRQHKKGFSIMRKLKPKSMKLRA